MASHDNSKLSVVEEHFLIMRQRMFNYFNSELLMDIVLVTGKRRIPAHKVVLAAASNYFQDLFLSDKGEKPLDEITLTIDEDILQALISFCYSGHLPLTDENVGSYLGVASFLKITGAVEQCCEYLTSRMSVETCLRCFHLADIHKKQNMWNASLKFIKENFERVIEEKAFLLLSLEDLSQILAADDLEISSEEVVFNVLKRWMEDDKSRECHALDLLRLTRLELLSTKFLQQNVECYEAFFNFPCMKLIAEAYRKHAVPGNCRSLKRNHNVHEQVTAAPNYFRFGELNATATLFRPMLKVPKNEEEHKGSTTFKGKVFVVGGCIDDNVTNSAEYLGIATNEWKALLPCKQPDTTSEAQQ